MPTQVCFVLFCFVVFVIWALILTVGKMLKEDKDDINHKEEMPNLLNEYKPDDQTLKLVKELGKEIFPYSGKQK